MCSLEKNHPPPHTADDLMWANTFLFQLADCDSLPAPRLLPAHQPLSAEVSPFPTESWDRVQDDVDLLLLVGPDLV